jgi:hypothetical protein
VRNVSVTIVVVLVVGWGSVGARQRGDELQQACSSMPRNIEVARTLRPVFAQALEQSPTIQRQCQRIAAAPHVRVTIRLQIGRLLAGARAEATISRFELGAVFAEIRLPVCVNPIEMLAHELEHVLEQMEGISLSRLAEDRRNGVSRLSDGAFETRRAEAAGRAAALEIERYERLRLAVEKR